MPILLDLRARISFTCRLLCNFSSWPSVYDFQKNIVNLPFSVLFHENKEQTMESISMSGETEFIFPIQEVFYTQHNLISIRRILLNGLECQMRRNWTYISYSRIRFNSTRFDKQKREIHYIVKWVETAC